MSEWWKYRPEDFLLFSPRAYWRMFELQNEALGALAILLLGIGGIVIFLAARRTTASMRSTAIILAVLWAFVGYTFLWNRYAGINWAIAYVAPAFGVHALCWRSQPRAAVSPWAGRMPAHGSECCSWRLASSPTRSCRRPSSGRGEARRSSE